MAESKVLKDFVIERQGFNVSNLGFNGTWKENYITTRLKSGYKPHVLGVFVNDYDATHYIGYHGAINENNGNLFFEHCLKSSSTDMTVEILFTRL